jgi:tetratricopeptide (TPR) repeat protein
MDNPKVIIAASTENQASLHKIIETEFRLSELVELVDKGAEHCHIRLENQNIKVIPDWADNNFPILITDQKFDPSIFLAIVYFKLGNTEKAIKLIDEDHELFSLLYLYGLIQNGFDIRQDVLAQFWQKIEEPNKCLFTHHLGIYDSIEGQLDWYTGVINALPEGTAKYYLIHQRNQLQFDYNPGLRPQIDFESRPQIAEPFHALLAYDNAMLRYNSGIANNDQESLDEIEMAFKNFIEVCVDRDEELRASLVHMDLAEIELIQAKYEIAHKSVNASLLILKKWEIPYFMARASVLKGRILYSWSKNGAPQYYKSSINAYQNALKVFTPSEFPNECAEIKSNLALLYTDMASSDREQPMWYALSASCFKEALELFESTRDYTNLSEVAHNYATALMNFPEAKLHDNLEKAKQYFELALDHRSARELPNQRVMTMLNFLELQFKLHNNNPQEEEMRLKQMSSMIEEIKTLTEDKNTLELADDFALRVNTLKDWMKNA